jgi:hypothetical protein
MRPLPLNASDRELIAYVDQWVQLLEKEDYDSAWAFTDQAASMCWTPDLIKKAIKSYGDALPTQKATLAGKPTDISQRKEVTRWPQKRPRGIGDIWYDINIDGYASDLTATFYVLEKDGGIVIELDDIHVM